MSGLTSLTLTGKRLEAVRDDHEQPAVVFFSMVKSIVVYVSGHGYGHAARVNAVLREAVRLRPEVRILVRTTAAAMIFDDRFQIEHAAIDVPAVESADALAVDTVATARNYRRLLADEVAIMRREVGAVRAAEADIVFADFPFLAGDVAKAAGVPCFGMSNFMWDWILADCGDENLLSRMRASYGLFAAAFRLPLSHAEGWEAFAQTIDVPLVTPRSNRPRRAIRKELGLSDDARNVVLIGGRATLSDAAAERLRVEARDYVFLTNQHLPDYSDLIRAADVVVSKNGYSMAAECIAEGVRLLYPPRTGFREEEAILTTEVPQFLPVLSIPYSDWAAGAWGRWLRAVQDLPPPVRTINVHGARVVAELLLDHGDKC